jgi:hypothetical protein
MSEKCNHGIVKGAHCCSCAANVDFILKTETAGATERLQEIVNAHSDPDDPGYNECDKPGEQCMWCEEAVAIIKAFNP